MSNVAWFPDTLFRLRGAYAYRSARGSIEWRGRVIGVTSDDKAIIRCDDGYNRALGIHQFFVHPETLSRPPASITDELGGNDPQGTA